LELAAREELSLVYRRVHGTLAERGAEIAHTFVGEYATSLEMAGASVSICHLDDELSDLTAQPADSPFFRHGSPTGSAAPRTAFAAPVAAAVQAPQAQREIETVESPGPLPGTPLAAARRRPAP